MPPAPVGGWRAAFPPSQWLPAYRAAWLRRDAVAGVTLAAYAIPVSLAYAMLAGLPPHCGVYGYLAGGLFYALFGSSRQLAVGPTSAISILIAPTMAAAMAGGDAARAMDLAALTALVMAGLSIIAWILRLSSLMNFVSETILLGFKAGAALTIAMTQLPKLFGVKGGGEHFFERVVVLVGQLPGTNLAVLGFGLASLALLLAGEKLLPGRPVALAVVALSIVVLSATPLAGLGLPVLGEVPTGLPDIRTPNLRLRDVDDVLPLAFACLLLAYVEGVSAARTLAERHGFAIDARQELLGLGAANVAVAFAQGYPVAGGLSQSSVNDKAGAQTPLALVFASITIAICLVYLAPLLHNLPNVVLATIVLVAVKGLVDIPQLRALWRSSRYEFGVAMIAFAGVLVLGILKGVMLAAIASLLLLIRRVAQPHVAFLGRIPGTRGLSDMERHPDNEPIPGALVFRVEAALLYFNVEHVQDVVLAKVRASAEPIRLVVCDLSTSANIDLAGARMLGRLHAQLQAAGIAMRMASAHALARDILRGEGLEERVGYFGRRSTPMDVLDEFEGIAPGG
ncbi:SulP family inorganic anion transporter [Variovorax sp. J22P240]|uniref:SulP family inorganic anion transporter n=1 Tax=unclassified Variovorax TaxID=663243 RepID=UPI0025749F7A|nr:MULTISPECIES: SulP family inorganic anion transporter [unclassified Variovorax]MDL9997526.1 SulP family inorganic anion transporter [Variovorax sp. J22P240]MDM0051562.1 SulP family inorganic anion transporter [Variovorax sp. J22R115]